MKKIILILGIIFLMVFSGCEGGNTDSKTNGVSFSDSFNGGDKALIFDFTKNMPPEEIYDNGLRSFQMRFQIENQGEYDIPESEAFITLSNFDAKVLGLSDTSKSIPQIRGFKKQGDNTVEGGKQSVTYSDLKYTDEVVGSYPLNFNANICYPYQTRAFGAICLGKNTNLAIDDENQNCKIEDDKKYANSGAPVKIENLKQYSAGNSKIMIQFDIVHKPMSNKANIYQIDSLDQNCRVDGNSISSSEAFRKKNVVSYTVDTGIEGLKCGGANDNTDKVVLDNDSNLATVTCTQDTSSLDEDIFEKPIKITLNYDYWDRISKKINIIHQDK